MNPNEGVLTTSGCHWLLLSTIPKLLPGVRVHLTIDLLEEPRRDVEVNVFCSVEPPAIRPDVHAKLRDPNWCRKWDLIGAADPSIIALSDRARKYLHSPFWIDPWYGDKIFGISTIMSYKQDAEGHRLRHILRGKWKVDIPSKIFHGNQAADPNDVRQPYPSDRRECFRMMFHLCIENCRAPGYFTEKLMDCFRSKSVPVYWGDPQIGETFNTSGMILIDGMSTSQILRTISNLTHEDYDIRREAIEQNATKAEEMCECHNPSPCDKSISPAMCNRLGHLLREAQDMFLYQRSPDKAP